MEKKAPFKLMSNRPQGPMKLTNNRPVSGKAQGNKANTNTKRIQTATKSDAAKAKSGGKFKSFLGQ